MCIKAIETEYKNYRYRSRLEARWAVYFDTLGIAYEYEKEGFEFEDGTRYLPDFWLPVVKMWAEVKPCAFTDEEKILCEKLVLGTGFDCLLLDGIPEERPYWAISTYNHPIYEGDDNLDEDGWPIVMGDKIIRTEKRAIITHNYMLFVEEYYHT